MIESRTSGHMSPTGITVLDHSMDERLIGSGALMLMNCLSVYLRCPKRAARTEELFYFSPKHSKLLNCQRQSRLRGKRGEIEPLTQESIVLCYVASYLAVRGLLARGCETVAMRACEIRAKGVCR